MKISNDLNEENNDLLTESKKQNTIKNKKLILAMWSILFITLSFYIGIILLADYALGESFGFHIILAISTAVFIIVAFISLYLETSIGHYVCKNCNHKFIPKYFESLVAMHVFTTRYLKCPECNKRSWCKKDFSE